MHSFHRMWKKNDEKGFFFFFNKNFTIDNQDSQISSLHGFQKAISRLFNILNSNLYSITMKWF